MSGPSLAEKKHASSAPSLNNPPTLSGAVLLDGSLDPEKGETMGKRRKSIHLFTIVTYSNFMHTVSTSTKVVPDNLKVCPRFVRHIMADTCKLDSEN